MKSMFSSFNEGVANLPGILCFETTTAPIPAGQATSLTWEFDPAVTAANIDHGIGEVLTISAAGKGTTTVSETLTSPPAAVISFAATSSVRALLDEAAPAGRGATDSSSLLDDPHSRSAFLRSGFQRPLVRSAAG